MDRRKHQVSEQTISRARRLRREATVPEQRLWSRLRAGHVGGLRFRRQHPSGSYIVDFCCLQAKLAIELDGISHDGREAHDARRSGFLESTGLRVIRFTDDEVLQNLHNVVHVIACKCGLEV